MEKVERKQADLSKIEHDNKESGDDEQKQILTNLHVRTKKIGSNSIMFYFN